MSKDKVWYKWPRGYYQKGWLPWYVILFRLIFFPIAFSAIILLFIILLCGYGKQEALDLWEHFF